MQNETFKIWLDPVILNSGLTRIDVKTENAPSDLFGVSFHIESSGVGFELKEYEAGNVFGGVDPMLMVTDRYDESGHSIIYGISLKRTDEAVVRDGVLSSFVVETFEQGELNFDFSHKVASIYDDGRKDIETTWQGIGLSIQDTGIELVDKGEADVNEAFHEEVLNSGDLAADVFGVSKISPIGDDQIVSIYLFLVLVFVALLVIFGTYLLILRRKWLSRVPSFKSSQKNIRDYEDLDF